MTSGSKCLLAWNCNSFHGRKGEAKAPSLADLSEGSEKMLLGEAVGSKKKQNSRCKEGFGRFLTRTIDALVRKIKYFSKIPELAPEITIRQQKYISLLTKVSAEM